jgi:RNA polymerase sigma-70 factor (ECF subfamily)
MTDDVVAERASTGLGGEDDLVERARAGDPRAFDTLVAARVGSAFRLAKAIVGDPGVAEDVTQEAFLQAWRNLPSLREAGRFDAWLGRILVNAARMHLRSRRRVITVAIDDLNPSDAAFGEADVGIQGVPEADALQRAIDRLSVDQRTILALHHVEELRVTEIAAMLAIPVGTAKWRLHEARAALERAMESQR